MKVYHEVKAKSSLDQSSVHAVWFICKSSAQLIAPASYSEEPGQGCEKLLITLSLPRYFYK